MIEGEKRQCQARTMRRYEIKKNEHDSKTTPSGDVRQARMETDLLKSLQWSYPTCHSNVTIHFK